MFRILRGFLPASRIAMLWWAWRHRAEIGDWARFAAEGVQRLRSGESFSRIKDDAIAKHRRAKQPPARGRRLRSLRGMRST